MVPGGCDGKGRSASTTTKVPAPGSRRTAPAAQCPRRAATRRAAGSAPKIWL